MYAYQTFGCNKLVNHLSSTFKIFKRQTLVRLNFGELTTICQICQYFTTSIFCHIRYIQLHVTFNNFTKCVKSNGSWQVSDNIPELSSSWTDSDKVRPLFLDHQGCLLLHCLCIKNCTILNRLWMNTQNLHYLYDFIA